MTVLSYQSIKARGIFSPFCERTVHGTGMTYGCGAASYDVRVAELIKLPQNTVVLASTMEEFTMPDDVCGVVHDKSSLARIGLLVQNTFIDPGWRGFLTLELSYHVLHGQGWGQGSPFLIMEPGTPVAQIVLHQLDEPTQQPYRGRYQNQPAGPQGSKLR